MKKTVLDNFQVNYNLVFLSFVLILNRVIYTNTNLLYTSIINFYGAIPSEAIIRRVHNNCIYLTMIFYTNLIFVFCKIEDMRYFY